VALGRRASQRCHQQRGGGRRRQTSAHEGDQGRTPTLLSRPITPLHAAPAMHYSNDLTSIVSMSNWPSANL